MKKVVLLLLGLALFQASLAKEMTPAHHGYEQGKQAGLREGRDRVGRDAYRDGESDGYAAGLVQGQQLLLEAAVAQGLKQGANEGSVLGQQEGRENGLRRGEQAGRADGEAKAREAASLAATKAVAEQAKTDGQARALAADPKADGQRAGEEAGLQRAKAQAQEIDFAKARQDYRAKQFSSPPKSRQEVRQAPLALNSDPWRLRQEAAGLLGRASCPPPDWRYLRYGSDNEEYQRAYRSGYAEGVRQGFDEEYDREYRHGHDRAFSLGLSSASVVNLQSAVDQAYQDGFSQAHREAFEKADRAAHQEAFQAAFEAAYGATYAVSYPKFEAEQYKSQEQAAFEALYRPIHQEWFARQQEAAFEKEYPEQAKLAYDAGWKFEAADFNLRPVRLLQAWVSPTEVDGLGLLSVRIRNFSDQTVAGNRLRVSFGSSSSRFYHSVPPHTEMIVTGLLRMRGEVPSGAELFAAIESEGKTYPLDQVIIEAPPSDSHDPQS